MQSKETGACQALFSAFLSPLSNDPGPRLVCRCTHEPPDAIGQNRKTWFFSPYSQYTANS
jgi:hypothetical protein